MPVSHILDLLQVTSTLFHVNNTIRFTERWNFEELHHSVVVKSSRSVNTAVCVHFVHCSVCVFSFPIDHAL